MSFIPDLWCHVKASAPHEPSAEYYVAIGREDWAEDGNNLVIKVQMEYRNAEGERCREVRKAPSYPLESPDFLNVLKAIDKLKEEYYKGRRDCDITDMLM